MTAFRLVIDPNGHALLTTPEDLSRAQITRLRALLRDWKERGTLGVLAATEVVQVKDIDVDLRPKADA